MTSINVIRHSDGRTYFACGGQATMPTNPKAGSPAGGNTLIWNPRNRTTTLVVPRQNPVKIDSWVPQSSLRSPTSPITYAQPPFRGANAVPARQPVVNDPCRVVFPGRLLCEK